MNEPYQSLQQRRRIGSRLAVGAFVGLFHLLVVLGLIRAFAPDFATKAVDQVVSTFTVTITAPPPPEPAPTPQAAGAAGAVGKLAVAREVAAREPKVSLAKPDAPRTASTGAENISGAGVAGAGTGGAGAGVGPGSGGSGVGNGGGAATKAEHIAGQINNARDFPVPPGGREQRVGKAVILALTVSPQGRAVACGIYRSSGLPETDAVACRLAQERLRFRPATDASGAPVTSTFYWQQKFFF